MQAFILQEEGISIAKIKEIIKLVIFTIYYIKQIVFEKYYNSEVYKKFKDEYFINTYYSERCKVIIAKNANKVLELVLLRVLVVVLEKYSTVPFY